MLHGCIGCLRQSLSNLGIEFFLERGPLILLLSFKFSNLPLLLLGSLDHILKLLRRLFLHALGLLELTCFSTFSLGNSKLL